ncbi:hypothetical protein R1sor_000820 [Riccia sorocarpa]|uniref:DUF7869 domain-containing protein n=1 Tax=Riccia sorocarpa TaxID=122646 RepID=A0ABD3GUH4_9MARC
MADSDDHTGDLARTTSTLPLFNSLLDQTAFIASMGTDGAVDSTYLRNVQNARDNVRRPFKPLPHVFMLQMDNSAKDNKNVHVLAFCSELVIRGVFETVGVNFLMVGHTHEDVDVLFSKVSAQTINKDVLTLPALMAEIWDSETMHPVPLLLEEVADYKSYVDNFLGPLVDHSQPLGFRFSMANNVPIYRCLFTVDGPWWPEEGHTLWKKEDGQFRFPMGEPIALKLPGIHPRLNEVSPFIDNLTSHLEGTFQDPTLVGFRRYNPVISYWKEVKKQLECIQPLQDENLRGSFWPRTNHGTGFTLAQQHQETSRDGPEDDIIVINELQQELRAENNLMMQPYVGDLANRPRRAFIPLEDITEGKFVILRPDDAFEVEIPRMTWLGRAIGAVVQKLDDMHHGQFLVEWWRPKHRKSTNATNKERYSNVLIGLKDWEKNPGYFTPQWINATAAIYSWKYRSKGGVPQSARLNPLAKAAIESHFQLLDLENGVRS